MLPVVSCSGLTGHKGFESIHQLMHHLFIKDSFSGYPRSSYFSGIQPPASTGVDKLLKSMVPEASLKMSRNAGMGRVKRETGEVLAGSHKPQQPEVGVGVGCRHPKIAQPSLGQSAVS